MEQVDVIIIGAGVVGLAIAHRLSESQRGEIVVLEQHPHFGEETSSRNSEVIHAGMYYPDDTLKARLCVRGNRLLYELCERYGIPHRAVGKLIVANTPAEVSNVENLWAQGQRNGVPQIEIIETDQIHHLEPKVNARLALYSPTTGLVDAHQLMRFYEAQAESNGVIFAYRSRVVGIDSLPNSYRVWITAENEEQFEIESRLVINAAGLGADKIASLVGIDIDSCGYRQHPCKGEYFSVANRHAGKIQHLIYPTPTAISLGIHTRLRLDGTLALGPNAFYVDDLNYDVNPDHKMDFFNSVREFLPFIEESDLTPEMAGIRAKLQAPGEKFRDFVIQEEKARGLRGFINLLGIESPGLTASAAIAEYVDALVKEFF